CGTARSPESGLAGSPRGRFRPDWLCSRRPRACNRWPPTLPSRRHIQSASSFPFFPCKSLDDLTGEVERRAIAYQIIGHRVVLAPPRIRRPAEDMLLDGRDPPFDPLAPEPQLTEEVTLHFLEFGLHRLWIRTIGGHSLGAELTPEPVLHLGLGFGCVPR